MHLSIWGRPVEWQEKSLEWEIQRHVGHEHGDDDVEGDPTEEPPHPCLHLPSLLEDGPFHLRLQRLSVLLRHLWVSFNPCATIESNLSIVTGSWTVVKTRGSKPQKRFLGSASFVESKGCAYMFAGVYSSVVNCFDELSLSPPKNFMTTMMKAESAAKREEQLINVNMNDK